jgi:DNA-binding XRE family transcriptional regulator
MARMAWRVNGELRAWRTAHMLTQEEAARKVKVSTRTICTVELGTPVSLQTVRLIARAIGKSPAEIATVAE